MLTISLENADKLYALTLRLEVLTYLQGLVRCDVATHELSVFQESSLSYLWEKQRDVVLELRNLLDANGFLCSHSVDGTNENPRTQKVQGKHRRRGGVSPPARGKPTTR